jgi:hypothetical protein
MDTYNPVKFKLNKLEDFDSEEIKKCGKWDPEEV